MSTVNQVYKLVNELDELVTGQKAVDGTNLSSTFVSVGEKIQNDADYKEAWTKELYNRIGKTVISNRVYKNKRTSMIKHPFDFGCMLQKIYVGMPEATENQAWQIGDDGFTPTYMPIIKPNVRQKIFKKISTWECGVTIPDMILFTAFTNGQTMAVFFNAIFVAKENAMNIALESLTNMTRATFMARKLYTGNKCGAINLLPPYIKETGDTTVNEDNFLYSPDFLKWSSRQMLLWYKRIQHMSRLFNDEQFDRFTPEESAVFVALADYTTATASYLESDTFHNEIVKLPKYEQVPYWLGSGEEYSFDDTSRISVMIEVDTETPNGVMPIGHQINQKGIIALIYDDQAMGVTIDKPRSTSDRNNRAEYTNYYDKQNLGYFADMSENGIVFYVQNPPTPTPTPTPTPSE